MFFIFLEILSKIAPTAAIFTKKEIYDKKTLFGPKKIRTIYMPSTSMKKIQKIFIKYLRNLKGEISETDGTKPGSSVKKNLIKHRKNRYFYLVDLKNAYSSVNKEKLADTICFFDKGLQGYKDQLILFLKKFCFDLEGGLAKGPNSSPDLFNIYVSILLDVPFRITCENYNLTYTRYRDDLLFSSRQNIGKRKRKQIREIIRKADFIINVQKTKFYDLKKGPIVINGLGLEHGGRIFVPRRFVKKTRGMIHRAITKNDINLRKISGAMNGFFFPITEKNELNQIEKKLIKKYQTLEKAVGKKALK